MTVVHGRFGLQSPEAISAVTGKTVEQVMQEQKIEAAAEGWNIMPAAKIFEPLGPYPWLIEGLHIAPGRITLLSGDPDVGKTVVAMSIALAVATGKAVWNVYKPKRRGKVLHLNGEIGTYIARERYQRLARGYGFDPADLADTLVLSNYPDARLDDPDFEERLHAMCVGCELVILDSLRAFSGSLSEKDKEIGVALFMLARISERTGATIIVLHHNRKPSKDETGGVNSSVAGSNSIFGGAECVYVMFKDEKNGPIIVKHQRSPVGKKMPDFGLSIDDLEQDGDRRWGMRVTHLEGEQMAKLAEKAKEEHDRKEIDRARSAIIATLEKHAGVFRGGVLRFRAACKIGKGVFDTALDEAELDGAVKRGGTYHNPEWILERNRDQS